MNHMKMAKADAKDIDAAGRLMGLLDCLSRGHYPAVTQEEIDAAPLRFDPDDRDHLRAFYDAVIATIEHAPGYPGRVIGGMCYVVLYEANKILDPDADTIELHPTLQAALGDARRLEQLLRHLPGDALRQVAGTLSDTSDLEAFRQALDAADEAQATAPR